jgi:hypothetical protein
MFLPPSLPDLVRLLLPPWLLLMDLVRPLANPPPWQQQHLHHLEVFKLPVYLRGGQVPLHWAQLKGMFA